MVSLPQPKTKPYAPLRNTITKKKKIKIKKKKIKLCVQDFLSHLSCIEGERGRAEGPL